MISKHAARRADIICCATSATRPLIQGAWLKPGTHVDLVGGFTNDMREADDATIGRASVFVDSRWFTIGLCGDISGPIAAGIISEADIKADLFDLCAGRHGGRVERRGDHRVQECRRRASRFDGGAAGP